MDFSLTLEERWTEFQSSLSTAPNHINMEGMLMLIGLEQIDVWKDTYSKEEKQELMHVGTCVVLSQSGYFEQTHQDDEGWPHFKAIKNMPALTLKEQELFLKDHILFYCNKNH